MSRMEIAIREAGKEQEQKIEEIDLYIGSQSPMGREAF